MKYLGEDGTKYLAQIEAMQAKLEPLTDDWKILEDLEIDIELGKFDIGIEKMQDRLKYLDESPVTILPDTKAVLMELEKMQAGVAPLSEEGKRIQNLIRTVNDEIDRLEAKDWANTSWNFAQGFLKADEYILLLQDKLSELTLNTDDWREKFAELQGVISDKVNKQLDDLNHLMNTSKISTAEWRIEVDKLITSYGQYPAVVKALEEIKKEQEKNRTDIINLEALTVEWTKDLKSGLVDAIIEGNNFGDVLANIGMEMAKIALQMALFGKDGQGGLFGNLFGNIFSGMFGGGGAAIASTPMPQLGSFADGGVFLNGAVTPFAKGGVVARPTIFPMANGIGLMGEAGAEAVMPLARDSSGRLGVRSSGGGTPNVNIHIENQSGTQMEVETSNVNWDERLGEISINAVVKNIGSNGVIARMIKAGR
jgi:hypothetical protein